jgi:hypothetical protein
MVIRCGTNLSFLLLWEVHAFHWDCIVHIVQDIDRVGLGPDRFVRAPEIKNCFYIVKVSSSIVENGPRDFSALLHHEDALLSRHFL